MLEVENLSLRFGGLNVLRNVNFVARAGEVTALIGPNGAGKSALLNCISGHYQAEPGFVIKVNGADLSNVPPYKRVSHGISRTFQHVHLIPELTLCENIMVGATVQSDKSRLGERGLLGGFLSSERERRRKAEQAIKTFALDDGIKSRVDELPFGVQRKIDFARATLNDPQVLLLDEPASGMSREERRLIPEWVEHAKSHSRSSIVWIEHDMDLLLSTADAVVVLQHGEVVATGRPKENAADRKRVVDAYFHYQG